MKLKLLQGYFMKMPVYSEMKPIKTKKVIIYDNKFGKTWLEVPVDDKTDYKTLYLNSVKYGELR